MSYAKIWITLLLQDPTAIILLKWKFQDFQHQEVHFQSFCWSLLLGPSAHWLAETHLNFRYLSGDRNNFLHALLRTDCQPRPLTPLKVSCCQGSSKVTKREQCPSLEYHQHPSSIICMFRWQTCEKPSRKVTQHTHKLHNAHKFIQ